MTEPKRKILSAQCGAHTISPRAGARPLQGTPSFAVAKKGGVLLLTFLLLTTFTHAQILNPVKWKFESIAGTNGEATLKFTAIMESEWHIYSQFMEEGGPMPTKFTFTPNADYTLVGKVKEESKSVEKFDPTFMMPVIWFSDTAVFTQKVKLKTSDATIKGMVEFMACTDETCLLPEEVPFSISVKTTPPAKKKTDSKSALKKSESKTRLAKTTTTDTKVPPVPNPASNDTLQLAVGDKSKPEHNQLAGPSLNAKAEASVHTEKVSSTPPSEPTAFSSPSGERSSERSSGQEGVNPSAPKASPSEVSEPAAFSSPSGEGSSEHSSGQEGVFEALALGFLGGLAALLMPCIFPMLPFTIGYFSKQSGSRKRAISMSLFYGLSIIVVYVGLGLFISIVFGSDALNQLSTNGTFNLFFFLLLATFAASFLGAFEITLPASWISKADANADRKGLLGIFFMAVTLALVSFSCTGPIIGTLLVQTATMGKLLTPAMGMFGFALALALPFTLFSMFPSWLKSLPKSGSWLNSVKVVLGFLELALALKFLSNVDLAYHWDWLDREVFLALWIIIFGLMGFYLLGKLKLTSDTEPVSISPARLFLAIVTLAFTLYMVPGLWGAPLKVISAFLPPQHSQDFDLYSARPEYSSEHPSKLTAFSSPSGEGSSERSSEQEGVVVKYAHLFHAPHNLPAFFDYEQGLAYAQKVNKPVMIDFTGHACVNCRKMETVVWSDPRILNRLQHDYVLVQLYVDDRTELPEAEKTVSTYSGKTINTIGKKWADLQASKFNTNAQPWYILATPEGRQLVPPSGADYDIESFKQFLDNGLAAFKTVP